VRLGDGPDSGDYPPACAVFEAHADHARRQASTGTRFHRLAALADYLLSEDAQQLSWNPGQREGTLDACTTLLGQYAAHIGSRKAGITSRFAQAATSRGEGTSSKVTAG
jgi:hypothetical protein